MCLTFSSKGFPFDPPENIGKALVFYCFKRNLKGTLGRKELRPCQISRTALQCETAISQSFFIQKGTIIDNWAKGMEGIKGFIYAPVIVLTK